MCFGPLPLVSWLLTDVCIQGLHPSRKLPPLAVCSGMHNQFCADSNFIPLFRKLETAELSYVPFSLPSVSWSSSVSISWDSLWMLFDFFPSPPTVPPGSKARPGMPHAPPECHCLPWSSSFPDCLQSDHQSWFPEIQIDPVILLP